MAKDCHFRDLEKKNKHIPCSRNLTNSTSRVAIMNRKRMSVMTILKNSQVGKSQFLVSSVEGNSSTNAAILDQVNHFRWYAKHDYKHHK